MYSYNFDTKLNVSYIFNYAIKLHNLSHWNEKGREKSENTLLRKGDEENYLVRNYFSQFLFNDIFLNASGWIIPRYEKITYQSTRSDSRIAFEETRIENALSRTLSPTPCTLFLVGGGVISSREKIPFDTKIGLCQWTRMIRISSFLEILHVYQKWGRKRDETSKDLLSLSLSKLSEGISKSCFPTIKQPVPVI